MALQTTIAVIGGTAASEKTTDDAYQTGCQIARRGAVLVCGGLGGVMEAASRGAAENGGLVVGILPSADRADANAHVSIAIPTGMGMARNAVVVQSAQVVIAFPGSFGTLSEIALALTAGIPVVHLPGAWNVASIGKVDLSLFKEAVDPIHAVGLALDLASAGK